MKLDKLFPSFNTESVRELRRRRDAFFEMIRNKPTRKKANGATKPKAKVKKDITSPTAILANAIKEGSISMEDIIKALKG